MRMLENIMNKLKQRVSRIVCQWHFVIGVLISSVALAVIISVANFTWIDVFCPDMPICSIAYGMR
jgi:hypothetical protein